MNKLPLPTALLLSPISFAVLTLLTETRFAVGVTRGAPLPKG
jgi:hypothetical protein